jgi:hypothetical protein
MPHSRAVEAVTACAIEMATGHHPPRHHLVGRQHRHIGRVVAEPDREQPLDVIVAAVLRVQPRRDEHARLVGHLVPSRIPQPPGQGLLRHGQIFGIGLPRMRRVDRPRERRRIAPIRVDPTRLNLPGAVRLGIVLVKIEPVRKSHVLGHLDEHISLPHERILKLLPLGKRVGHERADRNRPVFIDHVADRTARAGAVRRLQAHRRPRRPPDTTWGSTPTPARQTPAWPTRATTSPPSLLP